MLKGRNYVLNVVLLFSDLKTLACPFLGITFMIWLSRWALFSNSLGQIYKSLPHPGQSSSSLTVKISWKNPELGINKASIPSLTLVINKDALSYK